MSTNQDKFRLSEYITQSGIVQRLTRGEYVDQFPIREDDKIHFVVQEAGGANVIVIRARIFGADDFVDLATITGSSSAIVKTTVYDEIQIEVTNFSAPNGRFKLVASGFSVAGGDLEVSTPAGSIQGTDTLVFTSNDASVIISSDGSTGIDISVPSAAGTTFSPEQLYTLTSTNIANKSVTLSRIPANANLTQMFIIGGIICEYGSDFSVSGSTLTWDGLALDGELIAGDKIVIMHN